MKNKAIVEEYCSFEVAKLLQNKGFDLPGCPFSCQQEQDTWIRDYSYSIPNPDYDETLPFDSPDMTVTVPHVTQSIAMRWLREVHAIVVVAFPIRTFKGELAYNASIYDTDAEHKKLMNKDYRSYEQACEEAIKYCLENLL